MQAMTWPKRSDLLKLVRAAGRPGEMLKPVGKRIDMRIAVRTGLSLRLLRALAAVIAALTGFLASCSSSSGASGGVAAASNASYSTTIALNNIGTLKSLFNRDHGHTRLILIFSPT